MDPMFGYTFPAIRGIQAGREYYTSMCPLRLIPRIFVFDEEELPPRMRAQRTLNKGRVPELASYILDNLEDYVFSALTASIDGDVRFEPVQPDGAASRIGLLRIPMEARFIINDGQHRRAAIEAALRERPDLGDETIAVVFFHDRGLKRCQQMFADLNRHAIRTSPSLGILYDYRDNHALLTKQVVFDSPFFRDLVETERTALGVRSRKLFTLSSLYQATKALVSGRHGEDFEEVTGVARDFWETIATRIPEWRLVRDRKMSAGEVRRDFIHSTSIVLHAIGRTGRSLLSSPDDWRQRLRSLADVDWSRSNPVWEGRAMVAGRLSKTTQSVVLTTNIIKKALQLPLDADEQQFEDAYQRGSHGQA